MRNPNLTVTQWLVVNGAVWYLSRKRRKPMFNFISGYKTYITVIAFVLRQVFKQYGYDVPDDHLSIAIDVVMGALVAASRYVAKPKADK